MPLSVEGFGLSLFWFFHKLVSFQLTMKLALKAWDRDGLTVCFLPHSCPKIGCSHIDMRMSDLIPDEALRRAIESHNKKKKRHSE